MTLVRRVARPMLASIFVTSGIEALRDPQGRAVQAKPVADTMTKRLSFLPKDPVQLVRINAGAQVGAGLMLATGRLPRVASAVLLASLVPTTLARHPFWTAQGSARSSQRVQFLKNVGLGGGLMLAAVDTEGKPSLGWRARRAGAAAAKAATSSVSSSTSSVRKLAGGVPKSTSPVRSLAGRVPTGWASPRPERRVQARRRV